MEESEQPTTQPKGSFATPLLVGLLVIAAFFVGTLYTKVLTLEKQTKNAQITGANPSPSPVPATAQQEQGPATVAVSNPAIKTFEEKKDAQICSENGKPVVYLFSTTWCPHCQWIKDSFDKVVKSYVAQGKIVAYHWDIDVNDNTLTTAKETSVPDKDMAVYKEFNPGGSIPTFVAGCKYFRVGNGYESQKDLVSEEAEFKAVIDDLVANK